MKRGGEGREEKGGERRLSALNPPLSHRCVTSMTALLSSVRDVASIRLSSEPVASAASFLVFCTRQKMALLPPTFIIL